MVKDSKLFYHALKVSYDSCIGCSHCMISCPTEAIRIRDGKAIIYENKCVDCGECLKVCPVYAIYIEDDDFNKINNYKHRIALVPEVFFGQFPSKITKRQIQNAILAFGFTEVVEVEISAPILADEINNYATNHPDVKPLISSFCPAIVRLIQVKFPSLTQNIMLLKPPIDLTSLYVRKKMQDKGVFAEEIGVFYISTCASKIAAIKSPVGEDVSLINGVINMDTLFNKVFKYLKNEKSIEPKEEYKSIDNTFSGWSLTSGESSYIKGRSLAIDGIHNTIEILEKVENEEIKNIDFLELRACDESCAGGVLLTSNRFLVADTINNCKANLQEYQTLDIKKYKEYITERMSIQKIKPRSMMKLDENMELAMMKLKKASKILQRLSLTDCTACGAPNCQAFANDIAQGNAEIKQCFFIQRNKEISGEITVEESVNELKKIWGTRKFINKRK